MASCTYVYIMYHVATCINRRYYLTYNPILLHYVLVAKQLNFEQYKLSFLISNSLSGSETWIVGSKILALNRTTILAISVCVTETLRTPQNLLCYRNMACWIGPLIVWVSQYCVATYRPITVTSCCTREASSALNCSTPLPLFSDKAAVQRMSYLGQNYDAWRGKYFINSYRDKEY
jgi:hypothetical protein